MADEKKPPLTVVSTQTTGAIQRAHVEDMIDSSLRELCANLLRICAGAGKPEEVALQIWRCAENWCDETGNIRHFPVQRMVETLQVDLTKGRSGDDYRRADAKETIVRGALRMVASELAHDSTQVANATNLFYQGIENLQRYRRGNLGR